MIHAVALFHFILSNFYIYAFYAIHAFYCYQDITKNDDFKVLIRNNSTHYTSYRSVIKWFTQQKPDYSTVLLNRIV